MAVKRSHALRPLSSEHHQALLVAFQLKKSIAGHAEAAGAPRDLDGLAALARRFEESVFLVHVQAEEELLGESLPAGDGRRLRQEHRELRDLLVEARTARQAPAAQPLLAFADLLERHVRWEERELFPALRGVHLPRRPRPRRSRAGAAPRRRGQGQQAPRQLGRADARRGRRPLLGIARGAPAPGHVLALDLARVHSRPRASSSGRRARRTPAARPSRSAAGSPAPPRSCAGTGSRSRAPSGAPPPR